MPKIIDITGQKFNDLTAIEVVGKSEKGEKLWRCQCECGREKITSASKLRGNNTKACGLCKPSTLPIDYIGHEVKGIRVVEQAGKTEDNRLLWKCECIECGDIRLLNSKQIKGEYVEPCVKCLYEYMVGKTYGDLTVLEIGHRDNRGHAAMCECSCGKVLLRNLARIQNGENRSCGCKVKGVEDLSGRKFHRLTVLERFEKQGNHWCYLCKCDCGIEGVYPGYNLTRGHIKSCGCLRRELLSRLASTKVGELNNRWRGGLAIYNNMRSTMEYKKWKKEVHFRYNKTCYVCGSEDKIRCHHMNSVTGCPEQIYDPNNGVCLCQDCHDCFHMEYDYGNNTRGQFNEFLTSLSLPALTE